MILTFGKHKGSHVRDVPTDYLQWLLHGGTFTFRSEWMKAQVKAEYDRRLNGSSESNHGGLTVDGVESVFRSLSRTWHPDRGGTTEAMQSLADMRDALISRCRG